MVCQRDGAHKVFCVYMCTLTITRSSWACSIKSAHKLALSCRSFAIKYTLRYLNSNEREKKIEIPSHTQYWAHHFPRHWIICVWEIDRQKETNSVEMNMDKLCYFQDSLGAFVFFCFLLFRIGIHCVHFFLTIIKDSLSDHSFKSLPRKNWTYN